MSLELKTKEVELLVGYCKDYDQYILEMLKMIKSPIGDSDLREQFKQEFEFLLKNYHIQKTLLAHQRQLIAQLRAQLDKSLLFQFTTPISKSME